MHMWLTHCYTDWLSSTIASLLVRFYDPSSGSILLLLLLLLQDASDSLVFADSGVLLDSIHSGFVPKSEW
jgi:ABC-type transport system involved in Fe-S cluster assembly fused permease/ATPase subunit